MGFSTAGVPYGDGPGGGFAGSFHPLNSQMSMEYWEITLDRAQATLPPKVEGKLQMDRTAGRRPGGSAALRGDRLKARRAKLRTCDRLNKRFYSVVKQSHDPGDPVAQALEGI